MKKKKNSKKTEQEQLENPQQQSEKQKTTSTLLQTSTYPIPWKTLSLFFLLPLLIQLLTRGNIILRFVDYLFFFPLLVLLFTFHRLLLPKTIIYVLMLFFLITPDYGAQFYIFISFFVGLLGFLFLLLPPLATIPLYLMKKFDHFSSIGDYFLFGLKLTGAAAAIFLVALLPHVIGGSYVTHPQGMTQTAHQVSETQGVVLDTSFLEITAEKQINIETILTHYMTWLNRPFFTVPTVRLSDHDFYLECRSVFTQPVQKTYVIKGVEEGDKIKVTLHIAGGEYQPIPTAPKNVEVIAEKLANYEGSIYKGSYSTTDFAKLTPEMIHDFGLSADHVFTAPQVNESLIQVFMQRPGAGVKLSHFYYLFEDSLLQDYPDYQSISKTKPELSGVPSFRLTGEATIQGKKNRFYVSMVIHKELVVIILGIVPITNTDKFERLYNNFLTGFSLK